MRCARMGTFNTARIGFPRTPADADEAIGGGGIQTRTKNVPAEGCGEAPGTDAIQVLARAHLHELDKGGRRRARTRRVEVDQVGGADQLVRGHWRGAS